MLRSMVVSTNNAMTVILDWKEQKEESMSTNEQQGVRQTAGEYGRLWERKAEFGCNIPRSLIPSSIAGKLARNFLDLPIDSP